MHAYVYAYMYLAPMQNIDFSGAVSNMYNKTVKSRACLLM